MTTQPQDLALRIGGGGWVMAQVGPDEAPFFVRVRPNDAGRLEPVELHVAPSMRIDSELLCRRLPLPRVEAAVNAPAQRKKILAKLSSPGPSGFLTSVEREFHKHFETEKLRRLGEAVERVARRVVAEKHGVFPVTPAVRELVGDAVPAGKKRPDSFYQAVAEWYSALAAETNRPATAIAEAFIAEGLQVPVTTVHRWVKRARELGFLGPGQKGRRG